MTAMTAIAGGIASLIVIRFVFGLAEAGAFPTATTSDAALVSQGGTRHRAWRHA